MRRAGIEPKFSRDYRFIAQLTEPKFKASHFGSYGVVWFGLRNLNVFLFSSISSLLCFVGFPCLRVITVGSNVAVRGLSHFSHLNGCFAVSRGPQSRTILDRTFVVARKTARISTGLNPKLSVGMPCDRFFCLPRLQPPLLPGVDRADAEKAPDRAPTRTLA